MDVSKFSTLGLVKVFASIGLEGHLTKDWFSSLSIVISTSDKVPFAHD